MEWQLLKEIHHDTRCHSISFAPVTSLVILPKNVTFCTAGADFNLNVYKSDLEDETNLQILKGHSSYINSICWEPYGNYLASVSDDHTCIIWDCNDNYENLTTFYLTSAGMSVKFHPDETGKLLVAEKNGIIHIYNIKTQQSILSVETNKTPLMYTDWSLNSGPHICCIAGGELIMWDLRKPSRSMETKQLHEDGGLIVKIAPFNELITASIGRPGITLKVINIKTTIPFVEAQLKLFGGLCWHYRLPYICAAQDRKLCFWKVLSK